MSYPGRQCYGCLYFKPRSYVNFCACGLYNARDEKEYDVTNCERFQKDPDQKPIGDVVVQLPDGMKHLVPVEVLPVVPVGTAWRTDYRVRNDDRDYRMETGREFMWRDSDPDPGTVYGWIEEILQPRKFAAKCARWSAQRKKVLKELRELHKHKIDA